jgi:hypothetical protein
MQKAAQVRLERGRNEFIVSKWLISVSNVTWIGLNDETLDVRQELGSSGGVLGQRPSRLLA